MPKNNLACAAVLLAVQDGSRINSKQPEALYEILCKPMLQWGADACRAAGIGQLAVLAADGIPEDMAGMHVLHAGRDASAHLAACLPKEGDILLLRADCPLLSAQSICEAYEMHVSDGNTATLVACREPSGRDAAGGWFAAPFLLGALEGLDTEDGLLERLDGLARRKGLRTGAYLCADSDETRSAPAHLELAALSRIARGRILERHIKNGVDIPLDDGILIGPDVEIGQDTRILPGTVLIGKTHIGCGCEIGPNSRVVDSTVGDGAKILASWLTESEVGEGCSVGPFSQFRPNTKVGAHVKVGDFVELKNTVVGDRTSVAHLTYLGDCDVGADCNFGCGVVTANYDGVKKYRTTIGDRAFVGCNTNLISPVNVGEGAYTAAGTTVDRDVPAGALSIGRARQEIKEGWSDSHIAFKKK